MLLRTVFQSLSIASLVFFLVSHAFATGASSDSLHQANEYLNQGQYYLAQQEAEKAIRTASNQNEQSLGYGTQGKILLILLRYGEAEKALLKAYDLAEQKQHQADYANSLGVLYLKIQDRAKAQHYFQLAEQVIENNAELALSIRLNRMRVEPKTIDLKNIESTLTQIAAIESKDDRVRYYLNLATIVSAAESQALSKSAQSMVIQKALELAYQDSQAIKSRQLRIEALDSFAELNEQQGNDQQALVLSELAANLTDGVGVEDLLMQIEWRKGRIYQKQGRDNEALIAFGKAIDYVQAIRRDIPIFYEDGKSSFRKTLEPLYLGYTNALLKKARQQSEEARQKTLLLARQTIELIKQSELEDFLGGRCLIEGLQRSELENIDTQAAVLYPIVLPDRLELLLSIGKTIRQFSVNVPEAKLRDMTIDLSHQLRTWVEAPFRVEKNAYQQSAESLYRWLIAPIEDNLSSNHIKTLVIVPDGILRLIPFAALFDGQKYLIEKYAVSVSPGASLLGQQKEKISKSYRALLAGISEPGPVVQKIAEFSVDPAMLVVAQNSDQQMAFRGIPNWHNRNASIKNVTQSTNNRAVTDDRNSLLDLQEALTLPGVKTELLKLKETLQSTLLFNEQFTVSHFSQQLRDQPFDIVHIASHGFFSSDIDKSFVMAYDDIIKLNHLKDFLRKDKNTQSPIQLLTFSACQTAEGDDRVPLGFAGAALKADAQSALGSLWPVSDTATSQLMISFYQHLTRYQNKAQALRQAQLELLNSKEMQHPAFWSPFILVGNWL